MHAPRAIGYSPQSGIEESNHDASILNQKPLNPLVSARCYPELEDAVERGSSVNPKQREDFFTRPLEPDPVIEAYKRDIDKTLIRENLKLTPEQRLLTLMELQRNAEELRRAGERMRAKK